MTGSTHPESQQHDVQLPLNHGKGRMLELPEWYESRSEDGTVEHHWLHERVT